MALSVLPIWRLEPAVRGASAASVAVFVREIAAPVAIDQNALADTYRLTARESEVCMLLAQALDIRQIAARLDLSEGTVRNHLKRAFEKTGMRSQAAIVALIRSLVRP